MRVRFFIPLNFPLLHVAGNSYARKCEGIEWPINWDSKCAITSTHLCSSLVQHMRDQLTRQNKQSHLHNFKEHYTRIPDNHSSLRPSVPSWFVTFLGLLQLFSPLPRGATPCRRNSIATEEKIALGRAFPAMYWKSYVLYSSLNSEQPDITSALALKLWLKWITAIIQHLQPQLL